jgi:signal transduction histidine kinase
MTGLRAWLRPPRNLLVLFVLVVCLPAATLVALGLRLIDQDRDLAQKRQAELLARAADQGVRALEGDLATQRKLLADRGCVSSDVPDDSVCVVFRADRMELFPLQRIPYYHPPERLTELPSEPFEELESQEYRDPPNFEMALEISRNLAASNDTPLRAGALLHQARILRKMGRQNEALAAFGGLSRIASVAINGEPGDLAARRTRCAILDEQSRTKELSNEAESIAADLRAGRWRLDRATFSVIAGQLDAWLGTKTEPSEEDLALAAAADWLYEKWTTQATNQTSASSSQLLNGNGVPVTVLWSFGSGHDAGLIAGPLFMESHWIQEIQKAALPERAYLAGVGAEPPDLRTVQKVQRTDSETGLPWTLIVTGAPGQQEPPEFVERRRNLFVGLTLLLILTIAGSYFVWRAVNREMAAARLQSDFVAAVSHEFRTPLTALRQFNELLTEDDGPTPEKRRSFYQAQTRATERLHRLVESVLDFGRMEAGRRPYQFKPLDAARLAHDVTEEFLREANGNGFSVECASDSGTHPVSADPEALSRALWNLLDNAVKYSGGNHEIAVQVARANGTVSIAVRDHGIGIPTSEQETIFQKFVRGKASMSGGIQGTGLGLAMVRHIVEAHGGTVNLQSAEGKGSTFTMVLPVKE